MCLCVCVYLCFAIPGFSFKTVRRCIRASKPAAKIINHLHHVIFSQFFFLTSSLCVCLRCWKRNGKKNLAVICHNIPPWADLILTSSHPHRHHCVTGALARAAALMPPGVSLQKMRRNDFKLSCVLQTDSDMLLLPTGFWIRAEGRSWDRGDRGRDSGWNTLLLLLDYFQQSTSGCSALPVQLQEALLHAVFTESVGWCCLSKKNKKTTKNETHTACESLLNLNEEAT